MKKTVFLLFLTTSLMAQKLPKSFVHVSEIDATIQLELRYFSSNNFIGKPIDGYQKNTLIITRETAKKLQIIQQKLLKKGLGLKIFDGYRPQQSVNHFVRWATDLNDTLMKKEYYPNVAKSELFKQGYIASKSGHSRGSTVDLTLINLNTKEELDMGSSYDFFGEESHPFYKNIKKNQQENRLFLREIMLKNGFKPYDNEWWHFTLKDEPHPTTYFNFFVK